MLHTTTIKGHSKRLLCCLLQQLSQGSALGTTAEFQDLAYDVKRVEGHTNTRARQSGVEVWKRKIINEFEPSV